MFSAACFAICIVKMKDSMPEMIMARRIIVRLVIVRFVISWEMAAAAPVLVLLIE